MLDRTPFLQFIAPRLGRLRERVAQQVWQVDTDPLPVRQSSPTRAHRPVAEAGSLTYEPVTAFPHFWGEMFDQCFWQVDLRNRKTAGAFLYWADQGEATAYDRGGRPLFGFDPGHKHQSVPPRTRELLIESICCRSGIWVHNEAQGITERGSRFEGAFLAYRNEAAWSLQHDLDVLLPLAIEQIRTHTPAQDPLSGGGYREPFDAAPALAKRILTGLDRAADAWEHGDLPEAARRSAALLASLSDQGDRSMQLVLTGHAHIDLVWLWPECVADFKACHSLANALSLMDRYPELVFGYSQPASYDAIDRRTPQLMKEVVRRVAEGSFEHAGATYVESDTQLACGENLLRAFEVGQEACRQRFGQENAVLWIPDVFGYAPCLPQLMAGFGVRYFYTTKQHWSGATRFPYSSFRWLGHDGSEVLAHVSWTHYNQAAEPGVHRFFADQHRQAGVHDQALLPTGYGDGGGGVNEAMLERARRMTDLAGLPRAQWGRIDAFFGRMAEKADELPVWRGELYLEYHRGVQTTHGRLKAAFRAAERGLQTWEAAQVLTGDGTIDAQAWKRLIFAQFHDHIPGSSIQRVYDEGIPELEAIAERGQREAATALTASPRPNKNKNKKQAANALAAAVPCLLNPLPLPLLTEHAGEVLQLPPLSGTALADAPRFTHPVTATPKQLKSDRVEARFSDRGEITALLIDGTPIAIAPGHTLAQAWTFPDRPTHYDAWDLDRHTLSLGIHAAGPAQVATSNDGEAIAEVAFARPIGRHSHLTLRYRLIAGSPALQIIAEIDWQDPQTLLKLVFPTDYRGKEARFGAPFGSTLRPQHAGPLASDAQFEVPGSRWAVVSDDGQAEGLALVTESRYGFGCHEGRLHVSLLRSAKVTLPNTGGDTTSLAPSIEGSPAVSDLGFHRVALAITRHHATAPREETPAALAETLFATPIAYDGQPRQAGLRELTGAPSLLPVWCKPLEAGAWLLRLNETLGCRGTATLHLAEGWQATETDLRGQPQLAASGKAARPRVDTLSLSFLPYDLRSVRIERAAR